MKKFIGYILVIVSSFFFLVLLISFFETGSIRDLSEIIIYGIFTLFPIFILGLGVYLIRSSKNTNQIIYPDKFYFKKEFYLRFTLTPKEYITGLLQIFPTSKLFIYGLPIGGVFNLLLEIFSPELDGYVGPTRDVFQILLQLSVTIIMISVPFIARLLLIKHFNSNEDLNGLQTYKFEDTTVIATVNGFESQFDTQKYIKVKVTPTLALLFFNKYQSLIIPRRAFTHPNEWETFLEALQNSEVG
jgi:hypothetical protein